MNMAFSLYALNLHYTKCSINIFNWCIVNKKDFKDYEIYQIFQRY